MNNLQLHRREWLALLAGFAAFMLLLVVGSQVVYAHAYLVRSEPAANAILDNSPSIIRIWFSEPVEPRFSEIQLLDRQGVPVPGIQRAQLDPRDSTLLSTRPAELAPGIYTVVWRALSAVDGHTTSGSFAFAVGRDQVPAGGLESDGATTTTGRSAPSATAIIARWLGYAGMAAIAGGGAFVPLVLRWALAGGAGSAQNSRRPGSRTGAISGERTVQIEPSVTQAILVIIAAGWLLTLIGTLFGILNQAADSAGVGLMEAIGEPLEVLLFETRLGLLFWIRWTVLALIAGWLTLQFRRASLSKPASPRMWDAGIVLSLGLLITTSLGSHAAAHHDATTNTLLQFLHLIAAAVWVGGLVCLAVALRTVHRASDSASPLLMARLVGRFSQLAVVCVATLAVTGAVRAFVEISVPTDLLDTAYGQALLVKLILLVPILGLAAVNLLLIKRRLSAAASGPADDSLTWYARIRRTVGVETLLLMAVLLATSFLTMLPQSRDAFGTGLIVRGNAQDLRFVLVVSPGEPGINTFELNIRDQLGRPLTGAGRVALIFSLPARQIGETEALAEERAPGQYVVHGGYLGVPGSWQVQAMVRRTGHDDVRTNMLVRPGLSQEAQAPTTSGPPATLLLLVGLTVQVLGLITIVRVFGGRRMRVRRKAALAITGIALALVGTGLVTRGLEPTAPVSAELVNPYPGDPASIARGRQIYQQQCAQCHGNSGRGDGPLAATMRPRPVDLTVHVEAHPEYDLYNWITNGVPGTAMPAFRDTLTPEERWDVLNFIMTFRTVDR